MSIHLVGPNDGEQSGGGPIRCRIIEDGSHTQHRLGLIEATVPPGPGGPPQHVHHQHDEIFIVTQASSDSPPEPTASTPKQGHASPSRRARRTPSPTP